MRKLFKLIYEVTIDVDNEILDEFELWLAHHVAQMLQLDAFRDAQVLEGEPAEPGKTRRIVHYFPVSEAALQEYFDRDAARMRQDAVDRFGDHFAAKRRVLKDAALPSGGSAPLPGCLNCGSAMTGQYCGDCGQRSQSRLISIWELLRDAFGDLLELDSRLWQTLVPLLLKPGHLTKDYLQGRRARYMPPFRTYLVLSVVFFIVAFFDASKVFNVLFPAASSPQPTPAEQEQIDTARQEIIDSLRQEKLLADSPETAKLIEEQLLNASDFNEDGQPIIKADCDSANIADAPEWIKRRLTQERFDEICERVTADGGKSFLAGLLDNVPAFLFLFLPFLALVMKALYPLSKRYYVEHLLFVVHLHAFFFLLLTIEILISRGASYFARSEMIFGAAPILDVAQAVGVIYPLVYTYLAMRRVYGQTGLITFAKYCVMLFAYFVGFAIMMALALLFTAVSL
jgi:hypothetical protein